MDKERELAKLRKEVEERTDSEDRFGFHSEYYIDPEWRGKCEDLHREDEPKRGFASYSKYKDDIYFISEAGDGCIIKSDVKRKTSCAIVLDTKRELCPNLDYIAVNCRGYFLYNANEITLFGFDGHETYTYQFDKRISRECIYIYDDKVYYSVKVYEKGYIGSRIWCVNMLTREKKLIWAMQDEDAAFDEYFQNSFVQEWGMEVPFALSDLGCDVICEFLYANSRRVIAGYTRNDITNGASYIICVDLDKKVYSILDCFATEYENYSLPSKDRRHIFSFDMLRDSMWVKTDGGDTRLLLYDIRRVIDTQSGLHFQRQLGVLDDLESDAGLYYLDWKRCFFKKDSMYMWRIDIRNGNRKELYHDDDENDFIYFWCFGDIFTVPIVMGVDDFRDSETGDSIYVIKGEEHTQLFGKAKAEPLLKEVKEAGVASLSLRMGSRREGSRSGDVWYDIEEYNEDCVGFHSEYYVDPRWRNTLRTDLDTIVKRGYTKCSQYKGKIYFFEALENEGYIISCDTGGKNFCVAAKLRPKRPLTRYRKCYGKIGLEDYANTYLAVNRQGYFLYNTRIITLFRFDGSEVYTHELFDKDEYDDWMGYDDIRFIESIYIYDDKVFYSETKKGDSSLIRCVNMLTGENGLLWETFHGDFEFEEMLRKSHALEWGADLPFPAVSTDNGDWTCSFLYANNYHVVAGYYKWFSRNVNGTVSYIICIDLDKKSCSILDCFAIRYDDKRKFLPSKYDRHIVSFDMRNDSMWVKTGDQDVQLYCSDIRRVPELRSYYPVKWHLSEDWYDESNDSGFYYFDGNRCFGNRECKIFGIGMDGTKTKEFNIRNRLGHYFWCFGDTFIVPIYERSIFDDNPNPLKDSHLCVYDYNSKDCSYSEACRLEQTAITKLLRDAKAPQPEAQTQVLTPAPKPVQHQEEKRSIPPQSDRNHGIGGGSAMTLASFRRNAASKTSLREELLAYRKSLPDSWDYNAFVGILLSVGGPKHGDAACMNYAIGQGDNGNNTKRVLEGKGLMPIFEKYKGKKIDEAILLSEVEDEIIAVVPEYEQIRQRFHAIMGE